MQQVLFLITKLFGTTSHRWGYSHSSHHNKWKVVNNIAPYFCQCMVVNRPALFSLSQNVGKKRYKAESGS